MGPENGLAANDNDLAATGDAAAGAKHVLKLLFFHC